MVKIPKRVHMEEVMKEIKARSASTAPIASFITIRFQSTILL